MAKSQLHSIRLRPSCKWWSFRSVTSNVHPKREKHIIFKQQLTTMTLGSVMVRYLYLLTQLIIIKQILYHKAKLLTLKLPLNLSTNEAPLLPKSKRQNKRSAIVTKRKQRIIPRRRPNLLINLRIIPNAVLYMFTNRCWKGFIQRAFLTKRKTR
jgi:hypothetical protein